MRNRSWLILAVLAPCLAGCGGFGRVGQGRVVEYDRARGVVTVILDSNTAAPPHAARYDVLPPVEVRVPSDPSEMGPVPQAGYLLTVDSARRRIVTYDPGPQQLRTFSYAPVEEHRNVRPDDPRLRTRLPVIRRDAGTITLYDAREGLLLTFAAAPEHLSLAEATWRAGDEVRFYYKQPGQALRLMNVTRTDLSKAEK